jgi:hypothetical protein
MSLGPENSVDELTAPGSGAALCIERLLTDCAQL